MWKHWRTAAGYPAGLSGASFPIDLERALAASKVSGAPVILLTSHGSEDLAIEALHAGISSYLRLPLAVSEFVRALAPLAITRIDPKVDRMIGVSPAMQDLRTYLKRIAAFSSNVLITGETGTGKEVAATFVHHHSSRASRSLITINCAAIPDNLLESELFGFERGAFTGANSARDGKLKLADGGTVLLDEIGDLSLCSQAKLLRVIETGEIQRLGGTRPQIIDVRIIAATNHNLETDPSFRQDLYFRLNVARVHLLPLRERREDIIALADFFRGEFDQKFGCHTTTFTVDAKSQLLTHCWPGNVRELRNLVEAAFIDPGPDRNGELGLPERFRGTAQGTDQELARILSALSLTHWNRSRAAEELKWSRMTLYRKMAHYKISGQ